MLDDVYEARPSIRLRHLVKPFDRSARSLFFKSMAIGTSVVLTAVCPTITARASAEESDVAGATVFLDPGHNGFNDSTNALQVPNGRNGMKDCQTSGTSTNGGYAEHAFNWDIVLRIQGLLEALGVHTAKSRPSDSGVGPCVDQRAALANAINPDEIISIHADGGPAWGSGFHVNYSAPPLNRVQEGPSVQLAQTMRDALVSAGLLESDYLGSAGLYGRPDLAGLNLANFPAVLVELGNMRNSNDAAMMESLEGRQRYAAAVAAGIVNYLRVKAARG